MSEMEAKKILYMREPIISTYTSYGTLFAITNDNIMPWALNNFIQIRYAHWWKMFAFDNHHMLLSNCPNISYFEIPQRMMALRWNSSIKDIIVDSINLNLYLYFYVDRYFLPNYLIYQQEHVQHEILIFGYDLENGIIHFADNIKNNKFSQSVCKIEDIEKAYWEMEDNYPFLTNIRLLQANHAVISKFNLQQVIIDLKKYLDSKPTIDLVVDQEFDFGFESIDLLCDNLNSVLESGIDFDIRPFHLLYEHKLLMEKRVDYMMRNGFIPYDQDLLNKFALLTRNFYTLRNKVIKFFLSQRKGMIPAIINILKGYIEIDKELVDQLIREIEKNTPGKFDF